MKITKAFNRFFSKMSEERIEAFDDGHPSIVYAFLAFLIGGVFSIIACTSWGIPTVLGIFATVAFAFLESFIFSSRHSPARLIGQGITLPFTLAADCILSGIINPIRKIFSWKKRNSAEKSAWRLATKGPDKKRIDPRHPSGQIKRFTKTNVVPFFEEVVRDQLGRDLILEGDEFWELCQIERIKISENGTGAHGIIRYTANGQKTHSEGKVDNRHEGWLIPVKLDLCKQSEIVNVVLLKGIRAIGASESNIQLLEHGLRDLTEDDPVSFDPLKLGKRDGSGDDFDIDEVTVDQGAAVKE